MWNLVTHYKVYAQSDFTKKLDKFGASFCVKNCTPI